MSHNVETMAYVGKVPWHGLGVQLPAGTTPAQIIKKAGIDWSVSKRRMYIADQHDAEKHIAVEGAFALTRDTDSRVLSVVGANYKPIQNDEAIEFFTKFCKAGKMQMETAGSLRDGRIIWALARIAADFKVGKGDAIKSYLLLSHPHVFGRAMLFKYTNVRVVCNNTYSAALRPRDNSGLQFRYPHAAAFDDHAKASAEIALGLAIQQSKEFEEAALFMASKAARKKQVDQYFCDVLRFNPAEASKKKDGSARTPKLLEKFRAALVYAPGAQIATAEGTWWGAFNAITHVLDHEVGRSRSTAVNNAWFGENAALKVDALKLATQYAGKGGRKNP